ncbi:MAG TPA: VTT domain-containing protein [Bryobacteraceae bacterium]|nr:VTT domain-containing protein [Bryobacteraceae bacterium]
MVASDAWHALLIFGSAFVLEDVAVLGAALLVANSMVSLPWAAASSFAGIWFGDLGLYLLARRFGRPVFEKSWFKRLIGKKMDLSRSEAWFRDHGATAIMLSRAVPGTRLPTYLTAGLLRVPPGRFIAITAAACVVWVAALFWVSWHIGMMVLPEFGMFRSEAGKLAACIVVALVLAWPLRRVFKIRIARWEFWPTPVFYIPVAAKYLILAMKYRSLSLPTMSNPGMFTGGLVGESKFETLADLSRVHPEFTARTDLVRFDSVEKQLDQLRRLRNDDRFRYPVVFKPNVAQRGFGFRIIHSDDEARSYFEQFSRDTLVQEYVTGPHEAGIFYYRFPNKAQGKIHSIIEKDFPAVTGDGQSTLEELIRRHPRASLKPDPFLKRFAAGRTRVLDANERLQLVQAGNHCQGAVFLDGDRLVSDDLERIIDEISTSIKGFFVGRYDVRYSSEEGLRTGKAFKIVELNGASAEPNIYDPGNSLWNAWRTMFRHWETVFEIADQNRRRGVPHTSLETIWQQWLGYQQRAAHYGVSD